jgi:hypothetical protein
MQSKAIPRRIEGFRWIQAALSGRPPPESHAARAQSDNPKDHHKQPGAKESRAGERSFLAVPDFRPHPALLTADFSPAFACFLGSQDVPRRIWNGEGNGDHARAARP